MKLYEHQRKIIDEGKKRTGLFLGTGSGKTLTALMLAEDVTMTIAPKTQKEDRNWERENEKLTHPIDLSVVSIETFRRDADILPPCDTLILDEGDRCLGVTPSVKWLGKKGEKKAYIVTSQIFQAVLRYIERVKPRRIYICTATILRNPMTVWAASKVLQHRDGNGEEWDFYKFRDRFYFKLPMENRNVYTPLDDHVTKEKLGELVRKLGYTGQLSDYFDVPDQVYKVFHLELTAAQAKRIRALKVQFPDPIVQVGKRHQVENGILSGDRYNPAEYFDNAKIDKILDLAIEFKRMVVFAKYTAQIAQIATALKKKGHKVFTLTGDTKDREAVILEANKTESAVFIAQSQISAGWQLGKTKEHPEYYDYDVMVFASLDYSVVNRIQAEGRILRGDNIKKNLYIDLIVNKGIDQGVYDSIAQKKDFNERIYAKK